ncbi:oligosaccharide flippase family protein [Streptococcus sp. zg-86]|uniref:Oligosaccharide flippase family protein n=1 Tax=Streptococcus zhangguiae TaxID=2664091 RepID=A0A6I4RBC6_9STRE|nr:MULTISPECIES: oligosaccharide flippase family protein [unclassified Streptococcus]MTB64708.1 oligosaccharide flippase family protein [Streptococcus sp. zg-86]MTB91544.1 oligosaccharide flippase family protein [Streptococcus sp. zg-36]MWV56789.1 oligosaccharide flippase family protein [Streptococcus sp. zg-70]QTH48520.1 oligosaccharide flippase family protein [Streptococcus sp. zg-86]
MKRLLKKYESLSTPIKASIWFIICIFVQKGISVVVTPIFTRLMSASEYGQYSVFDSWLGIITIFVSLNLTSGVYLQGLVKFEDKKEEYTSSLLILSTLISSIFVVLYCIFCNLVNDLLGLSFGQVFAMLIMIWTTAVFNFWAVRQRVAYKYKMLVCITLLVSILKPLLGILMVLISKDKVNARIYSILIIEILVFVPLLFVLLNHSKRKVNISFWRYALVFNIPLIPHYLSQTVLNSADRIMINNMVSTEKAGIYSLAYSIAGLMSLFNTSIMQTLSPWMYQKIKNKEVDAIKSVAYSTMVIVASVNLILIILAPEAVRIFAPPSYYEAIWIIPPVAMSIYFIFIYDLFAKFAFYYEKTKFIMLASITGAIVNIVLNYVFIKIFGYIAAGYTTLLCYIIYSICHYIFMNRVCDLYCEGIRPYEVKKVVLISILFLLIGNLLLITYVSILLRITIIISLIAYFYIKRQLVSEMFFKLLFLKNKR